MRLVDRRGAVRKEPVSRVRVSARGKGRLLGLDVDPEFAQGQPFAYLFVTTAQGLEVQRWRVAQVASMWLDGVVLGGIRAGSIHDSGRLRFGPDDDLYVLTGDAGQGRLASDRRSLNSKVLRLSPQQYRASTTAPTVFSIGHRNPQGLGWQRGTGPAGHHGPRPEGSTARPAAARSTWSSRAATTAGRGYSVGPRALPRARDAPAAHDRAVRRSLRQPAQQLDGVVCRDGAAGTALHRLTFSADRVTGEQVLLNKTYGRLRAVVEGPDGACT